MNALVYKDLKLLVKDNISLLLGQSIFILVIISANLGILGYAMLTVALEWSFLMNTHVKEKESGGLILLASTPYLKKNLILSKYVTSGVLFILVSAIYLVISEVTLAFSVDLFPKMTTTIFFTTLFYFVFFISITIPLYEKFDDSTMKLISIILIMGIGFIVGLASLKMDEELRNSILSFLNQYVVLISLVGSAICLLISIVAALKLYETNKE